MARPMNSDGERGLTQQDILNLARSLRQSGMKQEDVAELFGAGFGVPTGTPNYDQLFAQLMPTFVQLNQSEPENSIRRSIAREVMNNTPIWEIEQGIANAIERGDVGVTPGAKLTDLVSFARTLESEFRNYTNAASKEENQTVFQRMGFPDPSERYTVEQVFPEVLDKLSQLQKQFPEYLTGAVGSGAKLPERITGGRSGVTASGTDAAALLKLATTAMNRAQDFSYGGKTYDPAEIRDELIPQLKVEREQQKELSQRNKSAIKNWERAQKTRIDAARKLADSALSQRNSEIARAQELFQFGGSADEYRAALQAADAKYNKSIQDYETIKSEKPPTDLYGLLEGTYAPSRVEELKKGVENRKVTSPETVSSRTVSPLSGPGGYVGPARGESTMARTYDPYWRNTATQVLAGLQQKIDKSGRTPFIDAATNFMAFSKYINRK